MNTRALDESPDPEPVAVTSATPAAPQYKDHTSLRERILGLVQVLVVIAVVAAAILFAGRDSGARRGAPAGAAPGEAPPPLVSVLTPQATSATTEISATGTMAVRSHVSLTPQVSGRIVNVSDDLRVGGRFSAGRELLRIDPRDFQLALDQANADVAGALANLELLRAESAAAISNYALLHGDAPVPPLVAKTPQIGQGEAQLAAARARAGIARLELSRTSFTLPFDGAVTAVTADLGQLVTRGQPIGEVFALDAVEVDVPISQDELDRLQPVVGRRAIVAADSVTARATVERVAARLDERTRFARVFLKLDPGAYLPPGTFVRVTLSGPELDDVYTLPASVQQPNGGVWIVRDGQLEAVRPNQRFRTRSDIVVDAFDVGDGVVIGAVPGATVGLAVRVPERG